jgi:hypothetical protein
VPAGTLSLQLWRPLQRSKDKGMMDELISMTKAFFRYLILAPISAAQFLAFVVSSWEFILLLLFLNFLPACVLCHVL